MYTYETIKFELERQFPEYSFTIGKRIYGHCIIVFNSKYSGVDIFVKDNSIIVEAAIPEMKTRMLIGSGVLFLKLFKKSFSEPSIKIHDYLNDKYQNIKLRR